MPIVQVPKSIHPRQIDFEPGVKRSKPGALYFTPGSTKTITQEELDFLKKHHKRFADMLKVIPYDETKSIVAQKEAANKKPEKDIKRPKDQISKSKQRANDILSGKLKPREETQKNQPNQYLVIEDKGDKKKK